MGHSLTMTLTFWFPKTVTLTDMNCAKTHLTEETVVGPWLWLWPCPERADRGADLGKLCWVAEADPGAGSTLHSLPGLRSNLLWKHHKFTNWHCHCGQIHVDAPGLCRCGPPPRSSRSGRSHNTLLFLAGLLSPTLDLSDFLWPEIWHSQNPIKIYQ